MKETIKKLHYGQKGMLRGHNESSRKMEVIFGIE